MPRLSRVSFDFDNTLTEPEVYNYAQQLKERGFDVWIVTARLFKDSQAVYDKAKDLEINKEHVIFTNLQYKYTFLNEIDPIFHLDDDWIEFRMTKIRSKGLKSIQYGFNPDWQKECEEALIGYKDKQGYALTPRVQAKLNKKSKYKT